MSFTTSQSAGVSISKSSPVYDYSDLADLAHTAVSTSTACTTPIASTDIYSTNCTPTASSTDTHPPHYLTTIRCIKSPSSLTKSDTLPEHLISIEVNHNSHSFSIDKSEISNVSYAILMALTDVLVNHDNIFNVEIDLYVNDLFVFNIFRKDSLLKWKSHNWISSTGKPIAFVDILSALLEIIQQRKLKFQTHWIRVPDQTHTANESMKKKN